MLQYELDALDEGRRREGLAGFRHTSGEYLRMFYGDTSMQGSVEPVRCGISFFGVPKVVFGSDMPFSSVGDTLDGLAKLGLDARSYNAIAGENALRLIA